MVVLTCTNVFTLSKCLWDSRTGLKDCGLLLYEVWYLSASPSLQRGCLRRPLRFLYEQARLSSSGLRVHAVLPHISLHELCSSLCRARLKYNSRHVTLQLLKLSFSISMLAKIETFLLTGDQETEYNVISLTCLNFAVVSYLCLGMGYKVRQCTATELCTVAVLSSRIMSVHTLTSETLTNTPPVCYFPRRMASSRAPPLVLLKNPQKFSMREQFYVRFYFLGWGIIFG